MLPFAEYLLSTLEALSAANGGAPVRTVVLAGTLGIPERTARWYAALLERNGKVTRRSPKSGWLPAHKRERSRSSSPSVSGAAWPSSRAVDRGRASSL